MLGPIPRQTLQARMIVCEWGWLTEGLGAAGSAVAGLGAEVVAEAEMVVVDLVEVTENSAAHLQVREKVTSVLVHLWLLRLYQMECCNPHLMGSPRCVRRRLVGHCLTCIHHLQLLS
jgi:hypothetical protein